MNSGSSVVGRRRLAGDLRRHRLAAGWTIEDVARRLECSPAKISRIETGTVKVGISDLRAVLDIYGVDDVEREQMLALVRQSRSRSWWQEFTDVVPPRSAIFYGMEDGATSIEQHCAGLVPGLLQTEAYARALIATAPGAPAAVTERRVELRLRRQLLLDRDRPPRLWLVLDEAVLHRQIGGRTVLAAQLQHVLDVAQRPGVTVQVMPFDAGAHPAAGMSFTVFGFASGERGGVDDPPVVFREQLDANSFVDQPDQVAVYVAALQQAGRVAADVERSRATLAARVAELG